MKNARDTNFFTNGRYGEWLLVNENVMVVDPDENQKKVGHNNSL